MLYMFHVTTPALGSSVHTSSWSANEEIELLHNYTTAPQDTEDSANDSATTGLYLEEVNLKANNIYETAKNALLLIISVEN